MDSTFVDWAKLLNIVNSLAGPLITALAIVAAVMFYRADRRAHTVCLLVGCVLIFAQRVAHVVAWLPGIGYFDSGRHIHPEQIFDYNTYTLLGNLVAWILFVYGLLMVALLRLRDQRAAKIAAPA